MPKPANKWGNLHDVNQEDADLPPWERKNLGYWGTGGDKAEVDFHFRITQRQLREIQKIVQQRKVPLLETQSDVGKLGLSWVLWWVANMISPDPERKEAIDLIMWEEKVRGGKAYRQRLGTLLDEIGTECAQAQTSGNERRLRELVSDLKKHKDKIQDTELKAKASRLWIKYRDGGDSRGE